MPTAAKVEKVQEIKNLFESHDSVILTEYRGLKVSELRELRLKLAQDGASYRVLKNTLVKRAADDLGLDGLGQYLEGPVAIAFCAGEVTVSAKTLATFAKRNQNLTLKGGLLAGRPIDGTQIAALATLPSREQLVGQLLGTLQAPLSGFMRVLNGPARGLVSVLDQIGKQKS